MRVQAARQVCDLILRLRTGLLTMGMSVFAAVVTASHKQRLKKRNACTLLVMGAAADRLARTSRILRQWVRGMAEAQNARTVAIWSHRRAKGVAQQMLVNLEAARIGSVGWGLHQWRLESIHMRQLHAAFKARLTKGGNWYRNRNPYP